MSPYLNVDIGVELGDKSHEIGRKIVKMHSEWDLSSRLYILHEDVWAYSCLRSLAEM